LFQLFYNPTQSSEKEIKAKNVTVESLYALLLSPTHNSLSLLDLADNRIKVTVETGVNPVKMAVSPNKKYVMVINKQNGTVSSYFREDNFSLSEIGTVGSGSEPTDIIFNNKGSESFVVYQDDSKISVLQLLERARPVLSKTFVVKDSETNIKPLPYKIAINKDDSALYVIDKVNSNLFTYKTDDKNNLVQDNKYNLAEENKRVSLESILFNENKLYISDSVNSSVIVFDLTENKVETRISLIDETISGDTLPDKIVINKDNTKLYIINKATSTVAVVDIKTNKLIKHIALSTGGITASYEPTDISISNTGKFLYVTNGGGRELSVISAEEDKLEKNIGTTASSGFQDPFSGITLL